MKHLQLCGVFDKRTAVVGPDNCHCLPKQLQLVGERIAVIRWVVAMKQLQVFGRTSVVVWCNYYSSCWVRLLQMNNCSCLMDCSVEQLQLIHEAIAAIRGIDR